MPARTWRVRIEDMLESIDRISLYIERMNYDAFIADIKTVQAVERNLEIIGEAAANLPEELVEKWPHAPWYSDARHEKPYSARVFWSGHEYPVEDGYRGLTRAATFAARDARGLTIAFGCGHTPVSAPLFDTPPPHGYNRVTCR